MTVTPKTETPPADAAEPTEPVEADVEASDPPEPANAGYREMTHRPGVELEPAGRLPMELTPDDLVARLDKLHEAAEKALKEDVDYGTIPGVQKPSLYKPGAEKLCMLFMLDPETDVEERYDPDGHLSVLARTTIYHAPTGVRLGTGVGSCTTRETRYAFRQAQRECPICGNETIFKSKRDPGSWFCWAAKGGCGENFDAGTEAAEALAAVDVSRKARPADELADFYNTVLKMARKRSLIDGVLVTTGASAIYTQDVEDSKNVAEAKRKDVDHGVKTPKSWAEMESLLTVTYSAGVAVDFEVFAGQAAVLLFDGADVGGVFHSMNAGALNAKGWGLLAQKAVGACVNLCENNDVGDLGPTREHMQKAWASVLDGAILDGPDWRIGPEADRTERPS